MVHPRGYTVAFDGWHEEFSDEPTALDCFFFGLSERCRLKVFQRGSVVYKWVVQHWTARGWVTDSETGLILFPFWRRRKELYLPNPVIKDT